jgi:murein L,D-transpeptidase YcbB/YkuD
MCFVYLPPMKKTYVLLVSLVIFIVACNNNNKNFGNKNSKKENKITSRDYSITKENAYNDLFLDSSNVENFIAKNNIPDSLARLMRSFYNARNYQFAWFSSGGLTEQAFGFWSLKNYEGDTSKSLKRMKDRMDDLMANDSLVVNSRDASMINTELVLTENFITFARNNFEKGYVKRKEMERFIPFKKDDPIHLADSLLNKKHKDEKYFSDINESYKSLTAQLKKYTEIVKAGGYPTIPVSVIKVKMGHASPDIVAVKKLLTVTGDLVSPDTSALFDEQLLNAIENYQGRFGYKADGKFSASLLKDMNVSAIDRVKQILINIGRMRWMPQNPEGRLIVVNIPEFILHVYDGKNEVFDMNVVVGKDGHSTTIFSDKLTTIVFSPYWNVPESIVKKEIQPAIAKNKNYLKDNNMEITGMRDGLPVVRQKPGDKNSLGKVKFLFPNSFNIYFHDTPAKSLFNQDVRAYSHGCIRLSEPAKLADYLLKDDPNWTEEKINEAMNSGIQEFVAVKAPVPVFITYYTAWVDANGKLNFRNDIYGHDAEIAGKMFNK